MIKRLRKTPQTFLTILKNFFDKLPKKRIDHLFCQLAKSESAQLS